VAQAGGRAQGFSGSRASSKNSLLFRHNDYFTGIFFALLFTELTSYWFYYAFFRQKPAQVLLMG
jgi:hypothetical protein